MSILLLLAGLLFLLLLNVALQHGSRRPRYGYGPDHYRHPNDEFYPHYPERRYWGELDPYPFMDRNPFSERLLAIVNTVLFMLLLVLAIMYYGASAHNSTMID